MCFFSEASYTLIYWSHFLPLLKSCGEFCQVGLTGRCAGEFSSVCPPLHTCRAQLCTTPYPTTTNSAHTAVSSSVWCFVWSWLWTTRSLPPGHLLNIVSFTFVCVCVCTQTTSPWLMQIKCVARPVQAQCGGGEHWSSSISWSDTCNFDDSQIILHCWWIIHVT